MFPSVRLLNLYRYQLSLVLLLSTACIAGVAICFKPEGAVAQNQGDNRALTLRADIQEANAKTGVVTARGNVQLNYPARQIRATAAQAQYFSEDRRLVLSGNVRVRQEGNSLQGETVTYLIDEGRFIALPKADEQVESIYTVSDPGAPEPGVPTTGTEAPVFTPKPAFKDPMSAPADANSSSR